MTAVAKKTTTTTWNIDPVHTAVEFKVKHMMISNVKGQFTGVSGTFTIDDNPANSRVEATIDAASLTTGNADRDAHLKSPDFFDVAKYPALSFASTHVRR